MARKGPWEAQGCILNRRMTSKASEAGKRFLGPLNAKLCFCLLVCHQSGECQQSALKALCCNPIYHNPLSHRVASNTRLNGVSAARRKCGKPPAFTTSPIFFSPACAPRAMPTSCDSEAGVQIIVDAP